MGNEYYKEWALDENRFSSMLKAVCDDFSIKEPNSIKFHSQQDEDKYIIQFILKEKIDDGIFLEIGGCDGLLYSNTKTLEDHFGFSGIIIEPQKNSTEP